MKPERGSAPRRADGDGARDAKQSNRPSKSNAEAAPSQSGERGLEYYRRLFGQRVVLRATWRDKLDRASLPTPLVYLTERGALFGRPRGEWASIRCPVHKGGDELHPSMRVSLVDGHFRCLACGARGGDLVALHRLATGLPFRAAVRDLGGRFHDE